MVIVKTLSLQYYPSPSFFYCRCSLECSWFLQSQEHIYLIHGLEEGLTPPDAAGLASCLIAVYLSETLNVI